jgi:hypothetical protein
MSDPEREKQRRESSRLVWVWLVMIVGFCVMFKDAYYYMIESRPMGPDGWVGIIIVLASVILASPLRRRG